MEFFRESLSPQGWSFIRPFQTFIKRTQTDNMIAVHLHSYFKAQLLYVDSLSPSYSYDFS